MQCCPLDSASLGLHHPQLCPVQPLGTPKPIPALWEWQCTKEGGSGLFPALGDGEGAEISALWAAKAYSLFSEGMFATTGMSHSLAAPPPPAWLRVRGAPWGFGVTLCLCRLSSFVSEVFSPHA